MLYYLFEYLEKEFLSLNIIKRDVALIKVVTVIESLAIESSSLKATFKTKLDNGAETVSNALIQSASTQLRALDAFLENVEKNNYSLALLNNDLRNSTILLAKEKLNNKPSLDLSTSVEYSDSGRIDSGTEKTNGTIGLTLTIPIFQQNNDKSDIRKYQSQLLQAELTLDDARQDLKIQASNLYKNYLISKSNISSNNKQIESIQTSLESIQEEYNIGTKTINELIDAESELLSVKVNLNLSLIHI